MDTKSLSPVPRRIGGLENLAACLRCPAVVPRRIGGLERREMAFRALRPVPRRIGGLEIGAVK